MAGKLYDETGGRLTPSHASKSGKRYRYCISQRLLARAANDAGTGWRLLAEQLERDLGRAVRKHLMGSVEGGGIATTDAGSIVSLCSRTAALGTEVLELIASLQLGDGTITIKLAPVEMAKALRIDPKSIASNVLSFERPFAQRRRGVESRLTIGVAKAARDDILTANIARAEQWRSALYNGDDLKTIATREGITVKYLGEMLPFAFLSPKLVRAILDGRQPSVLTTNWLRRHGLPLSWAEQDRILAQL
ncbi:MAG: hypothetical protein HKP54_13435 [Boseongicola sp.]|nr:hypothetical protein [Boseongicola sp.]